MRVLLPSPEDLVDGQQEGVIQHPREQLLQDGRGLLDAGIGVDLDQPRPALLVQHEIIPENLEAIVPFLLVQFLPDAEGGYLDDGLYHIHQLLIASAPVGQQGFQVLEGELVP